MDATLRSPPPLHEPRAPRRGRAHRAELPRPADATDRIRRAAQRWVMRRNCALTPAQTLAHLAAVCGLHAAVALGFAWLGYPLVAAFSAAAAFAFAAALWAYARHAGDCETVVLHADGLHVEQRCGTHVRHWHLSPAWVRVEPVGHGHGLIGLAAGGTRVQVGRHLQPALRVRFAAELRQALQNRPQGLRPAPRTNRAAPPQRHRPADSADCRDTPRTTHRA